MYQVLNRGRRAPSYDHDLAATHELHERRVERFLIAMALEAPNAGIIHLRTGYRRLDVFAHGLRLSRNERLFTHSVQRLTDG